MSEKETDPLAASDGDQVLREVWRAKDSLSAGYDHDLDRLCAESRAREKTSDHRIVDLSRPAAGSGRT